METVLKNAAELLMVLFVMLEVNALVTGVCFTLKARKKYPEHNPAMMFRCSWFFRSLMFHGSHMRSLGYRPVFNARPAAFLGIAVFGLTAAMYGTSNPLALHISIVSGAVLFVSSEARQLYRAWAAADANMHQALNS